ncbi:MAG: TolC family protein [Sulfurimonas sp.]|nr:TolC family protein [Sulfurimonas sp.]MDQ7059900.1 TolC family protein [Sulfurimonas sp.]
MLNNNILKLLMYSSIIITSVTATSLQETMVEVLETSPVIKERLRNYRATQQDLGIAESEYYPSIDLSVAAAHTRAGNLKTSGNSDFNHAVVSNAYNSYETSLTLTQNIFDGYGTMNKVDYEEARILAAAYKYLEVANNEAFKMTNIYLEVLRAYELIGSAEENLEINEQVYTKVKDLFDAGLTTESEVQKIKSSVSLARSNLTVVTNNAKDFEYQYRRILGRMPDVNNMEKPIMEREFPQSIERASLYAIKNNPAIIVSIYDTQGAQALWKQRKKDFYPKIDFELRQVFNDNDNAANAFSQADDRTTARVVLTYNLFRGGADTALVQQHVSKINQEVDIQRTLRRETIEGLDLSWSANEMIQKQLKDLRDYKQYSERTLDLYREEYDLGRRSLLDLLAAQSDVINSRSQIITAEYDQLFAKYRILDAMGLLVIAVNGSANEFSSKVNLYGDSKSHEILDVIPVFLDSDNDKIADDIDLCDNSLLENNIMPYGCKKVAQDDDKDGVFNRKDKCPETPLGTKVDILGCERIRDKDSDGVIDTLDECKNTINGRKVNGIGCELDGDEDGVVDVDDKCLTTPLGYSVDIDGCTLKVTLEVNFERDSVKLPSDLDQKIKKFSAYLKANPDLNANIVGFTSRTKISGYKYNLKLSKMRAKRVKDELVNKYEINTNRLTSDGKGYMEPIADNLTLQGRTQNRRVEITVFKDGEKI